MGLPNEVNPSLRKAKKTSSQSPALLAGGIGAVVQALLVEAVGDERVVEHRRDEHDLLVGKISEVGAALV